MIPLWYANSGEDFKIEKYPKEMIMVTAERLEFKLESIVSYPLAVIGKENDVVYIAYAGKRLAIEKRQAIQLLGNITGRTKSKPKIMTAPALCPHDCSKCRGCSF